MTKGCNLLKGGNNYKYNQLLYDFVFLNSWCTFLLAISTSGGCDSTSFIPGEELSLNCIGGTKWRFNGSPAIDRDDLDMFEIFVFSNTVPPSSILQFDPFYTNQHSGNYTCYTTEEETSINITTQSMCVCLSDCVCVLCLYMCLCVCVCMCVYYVCIVCMYCVCVLCVYCVCIVCVYCVCVLCVYCVCIVLKLLYS